MNDYNQPNYQYDLFRITYTTSYPEETQEDDGGTEFRPDWDNETEVE